MNLVYLVVLLVAIFGIVLLAAVYYYMEMTKEKRLKKIREEKTISPENEAYNKVKSAKRITKMMKRKGSKDKDMEQMVNKAEKALESGKPSKAQKLADEAKEKISEKPRSFTTGDDETSKKTYTIDDLDEIEFEESEEAKQKREELKKQQERLNSLPDNYLESKFEMKRVREMLDEKEDEEAEKYYEKAEKCFENEDYSEALKYTVRCRKIIRGEDSELIASREIDKKEPSEELMERFPELEKELTEEEEGTSEEAKVDGTDIYDPETETEALSSGQKKFCPECGFEGSEEDRFCPKCGTELIKEDRCPECGDEVNDSDKFCRNCGTELGEKKLVCPDCGTEAEPDDAFCGRCGTEL